MQNRETCCLKKVFKYGKIKGNFCARKSKDVIFNVFLRCTYSLFIGDPYFCVTELIVARNTDMLDFRPIVTSVFTFENESR